MADGHDYTTPAHTPFGGLWWPEFARPAPGGAGAASRNAPVANTRAALSAALRPGTKLGYAAQGVYTRHWQDTYADPEGALPAESNAMWEAAGIPPSTITQVLKARYGLVWNVKLARRYRTAYMRRKRRRHAGPADAPPTTDRCPHCDRDDSTGHILGGCRHRRMQALYIARHDRAVRLILRWLQKHSRCGGCYTIMDACRSEDLPRHGADGKRLPGWLLPSLPGEQRARLRPDILRVVGLPADPTSADIQAATRNKGQYEVQIIEVGYTSDTRWRERMAGKRSQHWGTGGLSEEERTCLADALRREGWRVAEEPCIILIGTCGTVYGSGLRALERLGVTTEGSRRLLRRLHLEAVTALRDIIAARRQLDSSRSVERAGVG